MLAVTFAVGSSATALAETATVSGVGVVEVKRSPEYLRVQFDVMARGKNLADAMDKLKARQEVVTAELIKLGAGKDVIVMGEKDVLDEAADRQNQLGRMMAARNKALGKNPKPKTESPTVVFVALKVDFRLPANDADALMVAAKTLQEKIKAAELGGLKSDGKSTPEEEELAEESIGPGNRFSDEQPRGTPTFVFVAKLTEADRKKAMADAFAKAKQSARRLAESAGAELGELYRLVDQSQSGQEFDDFMSIQRRYGYGRYEYGGGSMLSGDEMIGMSAGKVSVKIGITADFKLAPAK
jgi:hypothetical protein